MHRRTDQGNIGLRGLVDILEVMGQSKRDRIPNTEYRIPNTNDHIHDDIGLSGRGDILAVIGAINFVTQTATWLQCESAPKRVHS